MPSGLQQASPGTDIFQANPSQTLANKYRLDLAHRKRLFVTTRSGTLEAIWVDAELL